jgi:type IV secretory pathway TrbD component
MVPDTDALRRRVLLTGVVGLVLFFAISWVIAYLEVSDAWLLVAMAIVYLAVLRPLLKPVRDAVKLRRRLAYQAYLDEKKDR